MKKGMKESYTEELASHGGPDHALATREGAAKRWIGVHAGRLLSLEMVLVRGADALMHDGRQYRRSRYREWLAGPAGSKNPSTCAISSCREPGDLVVARVKSKVPRGMVRGVADGLGRDARGTPRR